MESMEQQIEQVAELVAKSERIIFFTGAGHSTESGIPDFRGPDGIWSKYDFEDFYIDRFLSDSKVRKMVWELLTGGELNIFQAQPNPAHYVIAELEKMGKLYGVVTQNIDGLHQKAGVSENKVFQLHGDLSHAKCLSCTTRYAMEEIIEWMAKDKDLDEPKCAACKGMLKPNVVFFGRAASPGSFDGVRETLPLLRSLYRSGLDPGDLSGRADPPVRSTGRRKAGHHQYGAHRDGPHGRHPHRCRGRRGYNQNIRKG
jgi:NAD-dependent SIR2 family protein deacetylase